MIINKITIDGITTNAEIEDNKAKIDNEVIQFFRDDKKIPLNKLAKYYLNENLNFLCGSGTSVAIGGKTTNNRDLEFIRNTIEYDDKSQIDLLTSLKQQQALVLGEAFAFSSLIRIADANPLPHSETPKIFTNE